ncbi:MAG: TolC family protein, partial [Prevotella sp.]|nr:TolC family protein [Prevotella sp.]
MKKIIITTLLIIATLPLSAQATTPLSLGERSGVRLLSLNQLKDSALRNNIAIRKAYHNIDAAQEQRKEAFTNYFPNVSGVGAWFNSNKGMAKMDINLADNMSPETAMALAQILPPQILGSLTSPMSMTMMKNGVVAGITA